jgi:hypothetical protein
MSTEIVTPSTTRGGQDETIKPIVIDFGKHSRKKIKRMRQGRSGKLMDELEDTVASLREEGAMDAKAQPVIFIVRQRRRSGRGGLGLPRLSW